MAPLQGSDGFGEFSESLCYGFMLMYIHMYISRLKIAVNTNTDSVHVATVSLVWTLCMYVRSF